MKKKFLILLLSLSMVMGVAVVDQSINNSSQVIAAKHKTTRRTHKKRTKRHRKVDRTKIYTSLRPIIIGNKKSHIYHVYRQHAYRMNRSNAVYFKSEKAARAAGYRISKR